MGRFAFVGKRLLQTIPILLGIVFVVFLLLQVTPGDPARNVAGLRASQADLAQVRTDLGLDRPLLVQYGTYLEGVVQGDLGYSYKSQEPVASMIGSRLTVTLWLLTATLLLSVLIIVPFAIIAAHYRDRPLDHGIRLAGLAGLSAPPFFIGVLLLLLVALPTGWFPAGGFGETTADHVRAIVLPALTLAIGLVVVPIRSLRASIIGVLDTDYVATARALGLSEATIVRRFVMRNAAIPTITIMALELAFLLFGAVVVETTFALPGVGEGLVLAARGRDLPAIQGYTLLFAVAVVLIYLAADILSALLDPRVEISS